MATCSKSSKPKIRLDRATLKSPRVLPDGSKSYEAILARVGDSLEYTDGIEIPTLEALSDPEYLNGLVGISVLAEHFPGEDGLDGAAPNYGEGRRIGNVITSRFDSAEGNGAVIIEFVVPERVDQTLVENSLKEVSDAYFPVVQPTSKPGVSYQVKRRPNHIAVTQRGRATNPTIRLDALGGSVTPDEMLAKITAMAEELSALKSQLTDMQSKASNADSEKEAVIAEVASELGDEVRKDSKSIGAKIRERISQEARELTEIRLRADSMRISIPDIGTAKEARRLVAEKLGGEKQYLDNDGYNRGIIAATHVSKVETETLRNDSKITFSF